MGLPSRNPDRLCAFVAAAPGLGHRRHPLASDARCEPAGCCSRHVRRGLCDRWPCLALRIGAPQCRQRSPGTDSEGSGQGSYPPVLWDGVAVPASPCHPSEFYKVAHSVLLPGLRQFRASLRASVPCDDRQPLDRHSSFPGWVHHGPGDGRGLAFGRGCRVTRLCNGGRIGGARETVNRPAGCLPYACGVCWCCTSFQSSCPFRRQVEVQCATYPAPSARRAWAV